MIKFLPQNLDLAQVLCESPPSFRYHTDHFINLCSLLYEIPAKKRNVLKKNGFVPLNSFQLKRFNNNYKKYLQYLIDQEIIECDKSYVVGEKSKGYRYTGKYQGLIKTTTISKSTLTSNLQKKSDFEMDMHVKYDYLHKWFNAGLTIEYAGAVQKLMELYQADKDAGYYNSLGKLNINTVNLLKLKNQDYYFVVDSTSHRLHTNLTKLKKELRPHIRYEGQKLSNIDIQCCQPTLSLCLFDPCFYDDNAPAERITLNRIDPALEKLVDTSKIATYVKANKDHFTLYKDIVFKDFYTEMIKLLSGKITDMVLTRDKMKEMMYTVFYSDNRFFNAGQALPKRIFKELFPHVYEVFKMYKSFGNEKLAILLQKIESRLILEKISKAIAVGDPKMPFYTIHDSIVCPQERVEYCVKYISAESVKMLGFTPNLQIQCWG